MTNDRILRQLALLAGWGCVAVIAFSTLSPIEWRPRVAGVGIEHIAAFGAVGLFLGLAHPRRALAVALFVLLAAASLEAAQHLVPGRHGRIVDLLQKAIGGGVGIALAGAANAWLARTLVPSRSTRR